MRSQRDLRKMLRDRDHRGYPAYKDLRGRYDFGDFVLSIDHVQGDPFAAPSKVSVSMGHGEAGFPSAWTGAAASGQPGDSADQKDLSDTPAARQRRRALEDFLTRRLGQELAHRSQRAGSGKGGLLRASRPGPEVLTRTACEIGRKGITVRFEAGLPAHGRSIDGRAAERMLLELVPAAVRATLAFRTYGEADKRAARRTIDLADDQLFIRNELERQGLVAFVADGSVLPRESGASERPMHGALPFASPDSLRVTLDLPHRGPTAGMGIRRGITLIVGGGYHGKSTLLQALQAGVYDHVAGDGRELVITDDTACKLRAEDGRPVHDVDISSFVGELPNGADTHRFSTNDASGSTSQAASLVEDLEAGCKALLIDEDTSATNFMVRDALMEEVVSRNEEPITPFVERARGLWEEAGVSSVIVAGSSGAFFYVADTVIQMERYAAHDITPRVHEVLAEHASPSKESAQSTGGFELPERRHTFELGNNSSGGRTRPSQGRERNQSANGHERRDHRLRVRTQGKESLQVGGLSCNLHLVEQIADPEQVSALAQMVRYCLEHGLLRGHTVEQVVEELREQASHGGLPAVGPAPYAACGLAMPRRQEVFACLNRLRKA